MSSRRRLGSLPFTTLALAGVLITVGFLFLSSSTAGTVREGLVLRQLKALALAVPLFLLASMLPLRRLAECASSAYALVLVLLVAVFVVGVELNFARRWLSMPGGVFLLQPSELAKPAVVLVLARYLEFRPSPRSLRELVVPGLLILTPFMLVRSQPDLSTALMLLGVGAAVIYAAGARRSFFLAGGLAVIIAGPLLYLSPLLQDYQKQRVHAFLRSIPRLTEEALAARRAGEAEQAKVLEAELLALKRGSAMQTYYSQIAIGAGGVRGRGLGLGPINRLNYLPERHSDFVFSVVAEEWGLLGAAGLVVTFLCLGLSMLAVASSTRDRFGRLVAVGAAAMVTGQAFANIAVCAGMVPATGLPLPFISQGGSSMLSCLIALGLVVSVARHRHVEQPFLYRTAEWNDPFCAKTSRSPFLAE